MNYDETEKEQAMKELEKAKNMTEEELENSPKHRAIKGFNDMFNALWESSRKN